MKQILSIFLSVLFIIVIGSFFYKTQSSSTTEQALICRVTGCGKTPVYSHWDDRFCKEHLNHSLNHEKEYDHSVAKKKVNTERALTKEEAEKLRGTGYHGTRPYSTAESMEITAASVACKKCGMRSHNGTNSLCDACRYNEEYGFD